MNNVYMDDPSHVKMVPYVHLLAKPGPTLQECPHLEAINTKRILQREKYMYVIH